jgi:hypothetical protein
MGRMVMVLQIFFFDFDGKLIISTFLVEILP